MTSVVADMSMSLDGFVADPADGVEHLFVWFNNGDVTVPTADPRWTFRTTEASARHVRDGLATVGALICGRRLFDFTKGWGGNHPMGVPVFVLTHHEPADWPREGTPFTFVTDGIESALAKARAAAGDKNVGIASSNVAQQYLAAGLVDELRVSLVPVLLGDGIKFFDNLSNAPIVLEDPTVIEGKHVTHLYYRIRK